MRLRLALALSVALAACDDGGSGSGPNIPVVPWGNFRQNNTNSAVAGAIIRNQGEVTLLYAAAAGDITRSTPTIDRNGNVLLATSNGVISLDKDDGMVRWTFEGYVAGNPNADPPEPPCTACTLGTPGCRPVGRVVASPTVSPGDSIVFGSEGPDGRLFAIEEHGNDVECNWVFPAGANPGLGFKSSAGILINTIDSSLSSVFVGADDGLLRAVNADGTVRWSAQSTGPITSSPAVDGFGTAYATTPSGVVPVVNLGGSPTSMPASIGVPPSPPDDIPFQSSPAIGPTSLYAVGSAGSLFAITPPSGDKWQFTPPFGSGISNSPAFTGQSFSQGSVTNFDTVAYVVNAEGTAFAVRDQNGDLLRLQRCLPFDPDETPKDCRMDSCLPGGSVRDGRCSNDETEVCTGDSCSEGPCITLPFCDDLPQSGGCSNRLQIPADDASRVHTSPVLTGDLFVVVGTTDGQVCARTIENQVPGQFLDPADRRLGDRLYRPCPGDERPTRSSPVIGQNGLIYVTTDAGLYEIR